MSSEKPNVIFFFVDQQRWDTIGAYGQPMNVTPNLDKMADDGVLFEHAYTCQPVCGPARACIQTGLHATATGCVTNNIALPADSKTIAHYMGEQGYDLSYIGKWHLAGDRCKDREFKDSPVPKEFRGGWNQHWLASDILEFTSHGYDGHMFDQDNKRRDFPEGRYRADAMTDWAIEYLDERDSDNPFFMFLSYIEPHHQNDRNCYEGPHGSKEKFKDFVVPGDLEGTEGNWRKEYPDYLGCINSLDVNLGRLRETLKEKGLDKNTVIIFTSDHGSHFQTRNAEYKRSCHDGCIRIPMIACGPGFEGGKRFDNIVSLLDMAPTILNLGGVEVPDHMHGNSIKGVVDGTVEKWPDEAYLEISESHVGRAVRTHRWTYELATDDENGWCAAVNYPKVMHTEFLYDNEADPHQKNNLANAEGYDEIKCELADRIMKQMVAAGEIESADEITVTI